MHSVSTFSHCLLENSAGDEKLAITQLSPRQGSWAPDSVLISMLCVALPRLHYNAHAEEKILNALISMLNKNAWKNRLTDWVLEAHEVAKNFLKNFGIKAAEMSLSWIFILFVRLYYNPIRIELRATYILWGCRDCTICERLRIYS